MSEALVPVAAVDRPEIARPGAAAVAIALPEVIVDAGPAAVERFLEFFAAAIANDRTRAAYGRAAGQFLAWCASRGLDVCGRSRRCTWRPTSGRIPGSVPTVKQHLAAIRALCDWLVVHQVLPVNPAAAVRGPKHVVTKGATPVLTPAEARALLDRIDTGTRVGLRDRALLSVMVYSFARVRRGRRDASPGLLPAGRRGAGCGCTRRGASGTTCRRTTGPRRRSRRTSPPAASRKREGVALPERRPVRAAERSAAGVGGPCWR